MSEGNAYTNLLKLMKNQGYNKDINIIIGEVKVPKPLKIDLGSFVIDDTDLSMTQTMQFLIDGLTDGEIEGFVNPHTHSNVIKFPKFKKLAPGDKVLVIVENNNFYVIDRVV